MSNLVLVRHGESQWNAKGLWTGLVDVPLTQKGRNQAKKVAGYLKEIDFDIGFTPPLSRSKDTILEIKKNLRKSFLIKENTGLNERNYGVFTGKNKWEVKKQIGEEEFLKLRRGWDYPIGQGESLKDVYDRVVPFYREWILPKIKEGKNILIVSSGNCLRSLVKFLEKINDEDISGVELALGEIYIYTLDDLGNILKKEIKNQINDIP